MSQYCCIAPDVKLGENVKLASFVKPPQVGERRGHNLLGPD